MAEITLSTGKKIELREKKGQHHFIERKLLASSMDEGGHNIGGVMSTLTVQNIISIAAVDGEKVDVPQNLAEIFEVMDKFTYEEWAEFEKENMPRSVKDKLDELEKTLKRALVPRARKFSAVFRGRYFLYGGHGNG